MRLSVILTYRAARRPDGTVTASDKFQAEMRAYAERWPGPVDVYLAVAETDTEILAASELDDSLQNLTYHVIPNEQFGPDVIADVPDVLFAAIDVPLHNIPRLYRDRPTATVVAVEYTFRTRLQQNLVERGDLKGRLGGLKWNIGQEKRILNAVRFSDGFQANGYPALDLYRWFNDNAMVYLDNRASEAAMPTMTDVVDRVETRHANGTPIRIAFSGRIEARKGPLECVTVAKALADRGVDFQFFVAGDGPERSALIGAAEAAGLADRFDVPGVLDFDTELVPKMRTEVDIFFCPHPQGDPSCTYVETLAGGVPIIGYANEAVVALEEHTGGAVSSVPMGDAVAAADAIVDLDQHVDALRTRSSAALRFATAHSFEKEYDARVEHFLSLVPAAALTN
jgi:colanic acid/amylovoran biosynthesis glycosyltransferase